MSHQLPIFNIEDALTKNIVGGIATKALHRVLAVGIEITQTKPLHLYKDSISVAIHRISKKPQNTYRVVITNMHGQTLIASDITVKGATESINTLSTSVEDLKNGLQHMNIVSNIEYAVGIITDEHIQHLADIEKDKRDFAKATQE